MQSVRRKIVCVIEALTFVLAFRGSAFATPPYMDGYEIMARAFTALLYGQSSGVDYEWGGESWWPFGAEGTGRALNATGGFNNWVYAYGTDCSGLVDKCWEVPHTFYYPGEIDGTGYARYTVASLRGSSSYWGSVSRASMQQGDIYLSSDHAMIYVDGNPSGSPSLIHASSSRDCVRYESWYVDPAVFDLTKRRTYRNDTTGEIKMDNPSATYWHDDFGWLNLWYGSTSETGYHGHNYQVIHGPSLSKKVAAKWTPRFKSSAYYKVYVRYTSHTNRATNARYQIGHSGGTTTLHVNQESGGGTYVYLGRFYFNAGYSINNGCVALVAGDPAAGYTANEYVVADQVKFVYDGQ
ncbi:MAG: hypothetical protein QME41_07430 [Actinomycetota bacterium]|nr:hypothetical protein [Actinomycetota bacterium]